MGSINGNICKSHKCNSKELFDANSPLNVAGFFRVLIKFIHQLNLTI